MDIFTASFFLVLLYFGEDLKKNGFVYLKGFVKLFW